MKVSRRLLRTVHRKLCYKRQYSLSYGKARKWRIKWNSDQIVTNFDTLFFTHQPTSVKHFYFIYEIDNSSAEFVKLTNKANSNLRLP